jgi:hypothetical protein
LLQVVVEVQIMVPAAVQVVELQEQMELIIQTMRQLQSLGREQQRLRLVVPTIKLEFHVAVLGEVERVTTILVLVVVVAGMEAVVVGMTQAVVVALR